MGSKRSFGAAAGLMTRLAVLHDARGPQLPFTSSSRRCGAARHSGLSLQLRNRADSELEVCGTKLQSALPEAMTASVLEAEWQLQVVCGRLSMPN